MQKSHKQQRGITLIELMVALSLGLLILAGVVQVYLASKQSYRLDESLARLQENGRYILNLVTQEIRTGGYLGCDSRADIVWSNHVSNTYTYDPTGSGVQGFKGGTGWNLATDYDDDDDITLVAGSDVLRMMSGSTSGVDFGDSMSDQKDTPVVTITAYNQLKANDYAMVTDCTFGDLFQVASVTSVSAASPRTGNTTSFLPAESSACPKVCDPDYDPDTDPLPSCAHLCFKYVRPAMLMELDTTHFFVGHKDGEDLPAFYRQDYNGGDINVPGSYTTQPVITGIEDMRIRYGIDNDNDDYADTYVAADAVTDWAAVASMNICLQVASTEEFVLDTATSITGCDGSDTTPDHRLRQRYTATVTLRNQLQ